MWQELTVKLAPLSAIFLPIATGVGSGIAARVRLDRHAAQRLATFCENAALKFFLPFFVIESVTRTAPGWDLAVAVAVGFMLPLLAYLGMWLYRRRHPERAKAHPYFDELHLLASTYGGGNRGTALFILLFANSVQFNDYLKWFSLVDLGNFSCLMLVIAVLVERQYGAVHRQRRSLLARLSGNYAVITLVWVLVYLMLERYWPAVDAILAATAPTRKFAFGALVFLGITLRFQAGALRHFGADLLSFYAARLFTALCILLLLVPFLPDTWPLLLSAFILALMPPSSFLPAMVAHSRAPHATLAYVNGFAGAANVLYAVLIIAALVVTIAQAQ